MMTDVFDLAEIAAAARSRVENLYRVRFQNGVEDILVDTASRYAEEFQTHTGVAHVEGEIDISTPLMRNTLYTLGAIILGHAAIRLRSIVEAESQNPSVTGPEPGAKDLLYRDIISQLQLSRNEETLLNLSMGSSRANKPVRIPNILVYDAIKQCCPFYGLECKPQSNPETP
ncbi:MAG TPA: hypothetical protein VGU66_09020 [Candidatus Elarobacter sp.]|nr:hypothetical protein [Candidatus Elarobacter sp.]